MGSLRVFRPYAGDVARRAAVQQIIRTLYFSGFVLFFWAGAGVRCGGAAVAHGAVVPIILMVGAIRSRPPASARQAAMLAFVALWHRAADPGVWLSVPLALGVARLPIASMPRRLRRLAIGGARRSRALDSLTSAAQPNCDPVARLTFASASSLLSEVSDGCDRRLPAARRSRYVPAHSGAGPASNAGRDRARCRGDRRAERLDRALHDGPYRPTVGARQRSRRTAPRSPFAQSRRYRYPYRRPRTQGPSAPRHADANGSRISELRGRSGSDCGESSAASWDRSAESGDPANRPLQ